MMRPGAGQNYPRSGFPLEGKAAPMLLPVGKGIFIPCRDAGTKRPPARQNWRTESSRTAARLPPGLSEQGLSQHGRGSGGSGLAPCERPVPRAGGADREVGRAPVPVLLVKGGD